MNTCLRLCSAGGAELRVGPQADGELCDVEIRVGQLMGSTVVDCSNASRGGWHQMSTVLVSTPESSLADLCGLLEQQQDGWHGEETWQSRDGRLQLGFSHRGDHICVAVTVKHHHGAAWVVSTHIDVNPRELPEILDSLRDLCGAVPA